jgi:MoxR-like ATPase
MNLNANPTATSVSLEPAETEVAILEKFKIAHERILKEIRKEIIGQDSVVEQVLTSLLVGGHSIITGVPGLAKTLLIKTIASLTDLNFKRIQFTPDLMPADITGTDIIEEDHTTGHRTLVFVKGPIFANILLADEINRTPPKTQSALLEAMQEHSVTVGGTIHRLEEPFFVMATQNPLEQEGTYPLPEAQLDRFLFKLQVGYSTRDELATILDRTTRNEWPKVDRILHGEEVVRMQHIARQVLVAPPVQDYAIRLVLATHPGGPYAAGDTNKYIRCGASPRAAQALVLAAKVRALIEGRTNVSFEDVKKMFFPALRHRILLSFEAQAENVPPDAVLEGVLKEVKTQVADAPGAAARPVATGS